MALLLKASLRLVLANFSVFTACWATTFMPVPLEKMIVPADAVMMGDFLRSQSVVLEDGSVATEAHFRIERELGIEADAYGISEVKVYYPGGTIKGGERLEVEGAPQFVGGEKNVLLLKQLDDGRLWIQGLAMGTFKVVRMGGTPVLVNAVFPENPALSLIPLEAFMKEVAEIKQQGLKAPLSDKYIREMEKARTASASSSGNSRSIASVSTTSDNNQEPNVLDSFWLVTLLASLGICTAWGARRKLR